LSFGLDRYIKREKKKETPAVETPVVKAPVEKTIFDHIGSKRDWQSILEETVRSMVLFPYHVDYTRMNILPKNPSISPEELADQLDIPLGVAIIVLEELHREEEDSD
jgi:ribosomal protein S25